MSIAQLPSVERGAGFMALVQDEVRLLRGVDGQLEAWEQTIEQAKENAALIRSNMINSALVEGSLDKLMRYDPDELDPYEWRDLRIDSIAPDLTKRIKSLTKGRDLGSVGCRAVVTVAKTGMLKHRSGVTHPLLKQLLEDSKRIDEDEVIEGEIIHLNTYPSLGGKILMKTGFFTIDHIHGLVNPATGEPRAQLEIFGEEPKVQKPSQSARSDESESR